MKIKVPFFLFFICQTLLAQEPYSINYSINEGFPTSTVYSISQDAKGYLWFSTDVGIVQYDSHHFELFNTDNGLSDNEVFQMKTDFKGRTWLLTLTGKLCFIYHDKIYNESNSSLLKKASGSSITVDFYQDETNTIYITYRNGEISIIKPDDEVIKKVNQGLSINGLWKSKDSTYIIHKGIANLFTRNMVSPFTKPTPLKIHHTIFGEYLSSINTFYKITNGNSFEKIIEIPEKVEILSVYAETEKKIWLCTRSGLFLLLNHKLMPAYFTNYTVTAMTKDFEGGYWISTIGNGVVYIPSFDFFVEKLSRDKTTKLNCISINNNKEVWVGGFENDYFVKRNNSNAFEEKILKSGNRTDKINNIRFYNQDTYVIGKTGIKKIDSKGNETILGFSANDMLVDNELTYIGYTYAYTIPTKKIPFIINNVSKPTLLIDKRTNIFDIGQNKCVWIGTNYGLYQLLNNGTLQYWGSHHKNLQSSIEDVLYDSVSNTLFVATASKGMLTITNNSITTITTNEGLNSNTCNAIKKIDATHYLIGTNNGLNSLTLANSKFQVQNLNALISFKNSRINDIDYLNNTVYLATLNGLLYFDINNLFTKKPAPKCHIIQLVSNNVRVENNATLSSDQKDISIEFKGVSYLNQGNLTYFFKLNSKNEVWTKSIETKINYKSLPAGKYTFSVFCQNELNTKSDITTISFEILPPFWQKLWFIGLVFLIIAFLVYFFIKYRLNKQTMKFEIERRNIQVERDKAQLEKQMVELEQKALRLQMNPHFIFNALNTIKGYYAEGDVINASAYISKFSKLLRMLLENTEQVISLAKEVEMLEIYINLTKIRYQNKFEYELIVDKALNINEIAIPSLLLQPIVENAIIHGLAPKEEKGMLTVRFLKNGNQLECSVEDNGIGREASKMRQKNKEYESKALEITNERLALLQTNEDKASIQFLDLTANSIPSGTKVIITIPLVSIW